MKKILQVSLLFIFIIPAIIIFFPSISSSAQTPLLSTQKREATSLKGFCCSKGQVISTTSLQCRQKSGRFYKIKDKAVNNCKSVKILPATPKELRKKTRNYPTSRIQTDQQFKKQALQPAILPPPKPGVLEPPKPTALVPSFVDQQQLPDLKKSQVPGTLQWPSLVDLAIINITITPSQPRLGRSLLVTTTIKNVGLATPQKNAFFQMELTDDPYTLYLKNVVAPFGLTIPRLAPNEEHIITKSVALPHQYTYPNNLRVDLPAGNYKIHALINTSNFEVDEENNAGNNEMVKTFIVRDPAPSDLAVDNISLTSDCRIIFRFHNEGASIPDPDFNNAIVLIEMGNLHEQKKLSDVDPTGLSKRSGNWPWGSSLNYVTYTWPAPNANPITNIQLISGQTANVTVKLNPYRNIFEQVVTNNNKTMNLTCP